MIVQRSRAAERLMVFDVKQFKSLEGFLESGPQFVLQSYILLRNDKYNIDLNEDEQEGKFNIYDHLKTLQDINPRRKMIS